MPILRGSITFSRFKVELEKDASFDPKRAVPKGLRARAFAPIDKRSEDERSIGFVELENQDAVEFSPGTLWHGEHALFGVRVDTLKVGGAELKAELDRWKQAYAKEHDTKPSRSELNKAKANLKHTLRSRTLPVTKVYDVGWNLTTQRLHVWASSRKVVDEIHLLLEETFGVTCEPLVPAAQARSLGLAEDALGPTPELLGVAMNAAGEGSHVEA